jgi:hypothetical protein
VRVSSDTLALAYTFSPFKAVTGLSPVRYCTYRSHPAKATPAAKGRLMAGALRRFL